MNPGTIVSYRNREWIVLPSDSEEIVHLRPLTGATDDVIQVHRRLSELAGYSLPFERIQSASFSPPAPDDFSNATRSNLLWQAARLSLREGAAPFRSMGKISIRPRAYQFVPLLMGLRLDTVRLLVADDVGVGKTIEALLIVREMLERAEIKRFCVLCPPYLCDQWQEELFQKFNLESVIIRSGTIGHLERKKTGPESIYRHYPIQVVSVDFVKSERNKHLFLMDCPELVIVDEAHGMAASDIGNNNQHQRHELVKRISEKPDRHLILLTATPHNGIESAFRSLLGLLKPEFSEWDISALDESSRAELARHFVQRTRKDIETGWESGLCFPKRDPKDEVYHLSDAGRDLMMKTYMFCSELIRTGQDLESRRRRVRYWAALALMRCVMSSPAAALAALENRSNRLPDADETTDFRSTIFESSEETTDDSLPTTAVDTAEEALDQSELGKIRELGRLAAAIPTKGHDTKMEGCIDLIRSLLKEGFHPIVWCRYIATANYVSGSLERKLQREFEGFRSIAVTGELGDDERRVKIKELSVFQNRVLVATDCLSEGINLQEHFNAAIHFDLPWNPNRLEQREGRVDRFGQNSKTVRTIRYFSPENPIDGAVINVLLTKAREIHQSLGTYVPVPVESESVTEAVFNAIFLHGAFKQAGSNQTEMDLNIQVPEIERLHRQWDLDKEREKQNRTRFAQRSIKPEEVRIELEAADSVLGDPQAVKEFVLSAGQKIQLPVRHDRKKDVFRISVDAGTRHSLPRAVEFSLPVQKEPYWNVSFNSPAPEGSEYLGRNHRFVTTLAQYIMEDSMTNGRGALASRCGVMKTGVVSRLSMFYLVRIRYLLRRPEKNELLSEEVRVMGLQMGTSGEITEPMTDESALKYYCSAESEADVNPREKRELLVIALKTWEQSSPIFETRLKARAVELTEAHRKIRKAVDMRVKGVSVEAQPPPDLLGVLVLQPQVKG